MSAVAPWILRFRRSRPGDLQRGAPALEHRLPHLGVDRAEVADQVPQLRRELEALLLPSRWPAAARIWKLYGTVAAKGDHTPERLHRLSRLCAVLEKDEARAERTAVRGVAEKHVEVVGWHAPDGGAYLLPYIARRAVEGVLRPEGLNRVSQEALYGQLDELGYVGSRESGQRTTHFYAGNHQTVRVLHLAAAALIAEDAVP